MTNESLPAEQKTPFAEAWEAFRQDIANVAIFDASTTYLENRLHAAFCAGWNAGTSACADAAANDEVPMSDLIAKLRFHAARDNCVSHDWGGEYFDAGEDCENAANIIEQLERDIVETPAREVLTSKKEILHELAELRDRLLDTIGNDYARDVENIMAMVESADETPVAPNTITVRCKCGWIGVTGLLAYAPHLDRYSCPKCREPFRPVPASQVKTNDARPQGSVHRGEAAAAAGAELTATGSTEKPAAPLCQVDGFPCQLDERCEDCPHPRNEK